KRLVLLAGNRIQLVRNLKGLTIAASRASWDQRIGVPAEAQSMPCAGSGFVRGLLFDLDIPLPKHLDMAAGGNHVLCSRVFEVAHQNLNAAQPGCLQHKLKRNDLVTSCEETNEILGPIPHRVLIPVVSLEIVVIDGVVFVGLVSLRINSDAVGDSPNVDWRFSG